ncbi:hypothetical protein ABFX02_14G067700 [Erythranthe guttata]
MGNHKFRLSDMMPNAWFYKLRDMSIKSRSINNNPYPTKSSYRITDTNPNNKTFDKSPRKSSSKKKSKRKTVYMPSPKKQPQINNNPSVLFPGPDRNFPVWLKPGTVLDHHQERFLEDDESDSLDAATCNDSCCTCKLVIATTSSEADDDDEDDGGDIIIDVSGNNRPTIDNLMNGFEEFNELPPIRTKPAAKPALPSSENDKNAPRAKKSKKIAARKSVSRASGVKIRANGPRVASNGSRRKPTSVKLSGDRDYDYDYEDEEKKKKKGLSFYSESFAIVKASFDPEKDFRESMMEMIVENNIRASKELEHLLACYLSLNSYQYHDLIVKAFEQIWFNMPQLEIN